MDDLFETFLDDTAAGNAAGSESSSGSCAKGALAVVCGSFLAGLGFEAGRETTGYAGSKLSGLFSDK